MAKWPQDLTEDQIDQLDEIEFDYEAFGPGDDIDQAESGLQVSVHYGVVEAHEWTYVLPYFDEPTEDDEAEPWSVVSVYHSLPELMNPAAKFRKSYSGDRGESLGDLLRMSPEQQQDVIVSAAISSIAYGGDERRAAAIFR